jgi:SAM-dependent methyltransferase
VPLLGRSLEPERMDRPGCPPAEIRGALRDIVLVNRWLGGARALLHALDPYLAATPPGGLLEVLDVGTGSADLAAAMEERGRRRGLTVRVTAVDRDAAARAAFATTNVRVVLADARALPFADRSFDVVTASMLLHHFDEPGASSLLTAWARLEIGRAHV